MGASRMIWILLTITTLQVIGSDNNDLPKILILGDSIYQQPAAEISRALKGKAEVVFRNIQPGEIRNTSSALENLDQLIGTEKWALIHFNFGLGDLIYRAGGMKSFRVLPIHVGGIRTTTPEQYATNLNRLVGRLKQTNAKLVWASTTPIRHSGTNVFQKGSEIEYNIIAAKIMKTHNVPINDMYSFVKSIINMEKPASHNADPFFFDRQPLHPPLVQSISANLDLK